MRLLSHVRVENFRSIRLADLSGLDAYAPLIGLNSSGKSNVLRALSLFFNGYLDEERTALDLDRDYPDTLRKSNQRKRVSVGVVFDLTNGFRPRGSGSFLEDHGSGSQIAIERVWTISQQTQDLEDSIRVGVSLDDLEDLPADERLSALSIVRAVNFRYVPNHIRPADFLATEIQPLRKTLLTRLRRTSEYKTGGVAETMGALSRVASTMLRTTSERVSKGANGRGVNADVPADFADLAFQVALQTVTDSGSQATSLQGSGTQSFTLLHTLDLLDRTSSEQGFGWRKANIWAIEEPESYLHAGLRQRFAADLYEYAADEKRQVFCSTHQDEFVRVGEHAWFAELHNDQTTLARLSAREALIKSSQYRVTTFQHPLMSSPDLPLVLVEGKWDSIHLTHAIAALGLRPRWKLAAIADLDPDSNAGGSSVATYLRANRLVLKSRPLTAPVLLLRDWEDKNVREFTKAVEVHETSRVITCPEELVNPELNETFRGIERYLTTELVRKALPAKSLLRPSDAEYPIGVRGKDAYDSAKSEAAQLIGEFPCSAHMMALVKWLDAQVVDALSEVPVDLFLG